MLNAIFYSAFSLSGCYYGHKSGYEKDYGEKREMADVPSRVVELIETFDRNIEAYRS